MKVCLSICICIEKQVTDDSYEMLIILFKSVDKHISEENLFKVIDEFKLTEKQYDTMRR